MTFVRENSGIVREAVGDGDDGIYRIKIIKAGLGSSAFYPPEVIERDIKAAFPVGTKNFLDHPTAQESWDQPERTVTKIAGQQVSEAEYDPTDQSAYANVQFGTPHRQFIAENYKNLGMSIYAMAETEIGTVGDYTGQVVTKLVPDVLNSVDVVTAAGAGGAIVQKVSESYKRLVTEGTPTPVEETAPTQTEGNELDIKDLKEALVEANAALVTALTEALKPTPAEPVTESNLAAEYTLAAESDLPKEARAVVFEAIKAGTPAADAIASQTKLVESIKASLEEDVASGRVLESTVSAETVLPKGW
jgi:hypothetical protein